MCKRLTEEGHQNFVATLKAAQDESLPLAQRQRACWSASSCGIVGVPHPPSVEPVPFCRLVSEGRAAAHKLWTEELSPQAQRKLARRAAEEHGASGGRAEGAG